MDEFITSFSRQAAEALRQLPKEEIAKALNVVQAVYERDGRIYIFAVSYTHLTLPTTPYV